MTPENNTVPKISIIIVNYNSRKLLKKCLTALLAYSDKKNDEIIIVDNSSTDRSLSYIGKGSNIKIFKLKNNIGYGAACNFGAKQAKGEILFFLNPDVALKSKLDSVKGLFLNKSVGAVAPAVFKNNRFQMSVWKLPGPLGEFLKEIKIIARKYRCCAPPKKPIEIKSNCFASGAALFVSADTFAKIRMFDAKFFMYYEDADLFKKIHKKKMKCLLDPETKVTHLGGGSSHDSGKTTIYRYQSQYLYFAKNFSKTAFAVHRLLTAVVLILKYLLFSIQKSKTKKARQLKKCLALYIFAGADQFNAS